MRQVRLQRLQQRLSFAAISLQRELPAMLPLLCLLTLFADWHNNVCSSPLHGTETESVAKIKSLYEKHHPETLEELTARRWVVQGDMVLPTNRNAVGNVWPTTDIPYQISPELESRTHDILSAMEMVSEHTCIRFHKRSDEQDYLLFQSSDGCAAYVGFVGGKQGVFVAPPCTVGNIAHEIIHAIGFQHEHTRPDRDQYITVEYKNIISGMEKNFKKLNGQTLNIPYDYTSIMHYGSNFFSANGEDTIVPKTDVKDMGQRKRLMTSDVQKIRHLYHCDSEKSGEKED